MNPSILFFTEGIKFSLKNNTELCRWIIVSTRKEGFVIDELNYIFCSDDYLLSLNQRFLSHDEYTDIITFDHSFNKKQISAEIFISIKRVKENAKTFKTTFQNELHRVMIHGVLHLTGYKDKTKKQQQAIRKKEDYYLRKLQP
ncbi:MAG: rRNA maturation RNase YbeY [Bacteroidia bacterium]